MDYGMEELVPIVAELAEKYGGYESTSVTYEKAQTLMGAVLYCLEEYHSGGENPARRNISVREQYDIGVRLVYEKAAKIREIFQELTFHFEDYGVRCLYDTVQKGVPEFLKWYDVRFDPQNTILTLDYPVLTDYSSLCGADAVWKYLLAVRAEQKFLAAFDKSYVVSVLENYNPEYADMIENICEIVLTNTIGHIAAGKPLVETGFRVEEYAGLAELLRSETVGEIEELVRHSIDEMIKKLYENDEEIRTYLYYGAGNIAVRIHTACQNGQLDKIFTA